MTVETIIEVPVRRHVLVSDRPFADVLAAVNQGIGRPDMQALVTALESSGFSTQFSALAQQAKGSTDLYRFLEIPLDVALDADPASAGKGRLVRLIAGNPVTMSQMAQHVADTGSYAPITILIQELPGEGTRVAYDTMASALAPYRNEAASKVAESLDGEVLGLLRQAT